MPKKNYKNEIMNSLKQPHNPFRLTKEELGQAETLLTQIENGENWAENMKALADMLEVVPLEMHENAEEYEEAVQEDAQYKRKPIHVHESADKDAALEALSQELEFQGTHAAYRYFNDRLRECESEEDQLTLIAAIKKFADAGKVQWTKECTEAIIGDYTASHGKEPDLQSVPEESVKTAANELISNFEASGKMLGYSGTDQYNISVAMASYKLQTQKHGVIHPEVTKYIRFRDTMTQLQELDEKFQQEMKAFTALRHSDSKGKMDELIDEVCDQLEINADQNQFSMDPMIKKRQNLSLVAHDFGAVSDTLYLYWRKHTASKPHVSDKDKKAFEITENLAHILEDGHDEIEKLAAYGIELDDYVVNEKGRMDFDRSSFEYSMSLGEWHRKKEERHPKAEEEMELPEPEIQNENKPALEQPAEEQPALEQPAEKQEFSTFDHFYGDSYIFALEKLGQQLQTSMDKLVETNTKSMWNKSSESYKTMYQTLLQAKGGESSFFEGLRKKSHKEVFDLLENIEKTAEAYGTEKRGKHSWGSSTAKTRLAAADDIAKCVKDTMKFQVVKEMKARDDLHMPAFIDKRVEAKRKLMNASELAKECNVNGWTELPSVKKKDAAVNPKANEKKANAL